MLDDRVIFAAALFLTIHAFVVTSLQNSQKICELRRDKHGPNAKMSSFCPILEGKNGSRPFTSLSIGFSGGGAGTEDMPGGRHFLFSVCLLLWIHATEVSGYNSGDIVPLSRRSQYHNMRTEWHDALGRHCPRFSLDREAFLPIPRPVGFNDNEPYKVSLQFGDERFVTPWLLIMGLRKIRVPMVQVTLNHFGGELRGARAKVVPMPAHFLEEHAAISAQYTNATHWPKHILLRYSWEEQAEVDVPAALFVLFGTAMVITTLLAIYILQESKDKIAKFIDEHVLETTMVGNPGSVEEVAKAD